MFKRHRPVILHSRHSVGVCVCGRVLCVSLCVPCSLFCVRACVRGVVAAAVARWWRKKGTMKSEQSAKSASCIRTINRCQEMIALLPVFEY